MQLHNCIFRSKAEYQMGNAVQENFRSILNVPSFPVFLTFTCSFPKVFPIFSTNGTLWANGQDILNIPLWNISVVSFSCILNFTGSVNYGCFTGDITKNTLNEPPRNTVETFVGDILNFPTCQGHCGRK
jgi:hypothetical protein